MVQSVSAEKVFAFVPNCQIRAVHPSFQTLLFVENFVKLVSPVFFHFQGSHFKRNPNVQSLRFEFSFGNFFRQKFFQFAIASELLEHFLSKLFLNHPSATCWSICCLCFSSSLTFSFSFSFFFSSFSSFFLRSFSSLWSRSCKAVASSLRRRLSSARI